jgi:AraC-like DNA-binding protein
MLFLLLDFDTLIVFTILLFLKREEKSHCAKIMGCAFLMFSLVVARYVVRRFLPDMSWVTYGWLNLVFNFGGLFCTPLIAAYFFRFTSGNLHRHSWWLFAPPAIVWIAICTLFLTLGSAEQASYIGNKFFQTGTIVKSTHLAVLQFVSGNLYDYLIRVQGLLICIHCAALMRGYHARVKEYYSTTEGKSSRLNDYALASVFVLYLIVLVFSDVIPEIHVSSTNYQNYAYAISCLCFFTMGYDAYTVKYTAADMAEEGELQTAQVVEMKLTNEGTTSEENALSTNLNKAMHTDKLYLRSDLTLDDLAHALQTNRTYLSKLVNKKYGQSFSSFISSFRVDHAKALMLSEQDATLDWVGLQSGFVSYNTFFHAFKKIEGMSPGKWRKNHLEQDVEGAAHSSNAV